MNQIQKEDLLRRFAEKREALARTDVDYMNTESSLLRQEKLSLLWYQKLADLNGLNRKRQMIASQMADLRLEIEKAKIEEILIFQNFN